jgi:hypothetical protein
MPDKPIITTGIIAPWLYGLLSADATIMSLVGSRVSGTLSSTPPATPYVTFLMQDHRDVLGVGGIEVMGDCLYAVKAVDRSGGWDSVNPIAARIHTLLHRPHTNISVPGGSLTTVREQIIEYPEVDAGQQFRHLGGVYRIQASHDT